MSRMARRLVIAGTFLSLNAFFWVIVYFAFLKAPETCFDGILNQNEQGTDCGGVCAQACIEVVTGRDLEQREVAFVPAGNNQYDVLGQVFNGNEAVGASSFRYAFELRDQNGVVIDTRSGTGHILPGETKSFIEIGLVSASVPARVALVITDVEWERFSGYQEKPAINIYQKRYSLVTDGFGYGEAYGLLSNESPYDFRSLIVKVILRDLLGRPLALNTHRMDMVKAYESRDFKLVWPIPFPGSVEQVDMEIDADVYNSENFIKQYFPGGSSR